MTEPTSPDDDELLSIQAGRRPARRPLHDRVPLRPHRSARRRVARATSGTSGDRRIASLRSASTPGRNKRGTTAHRRDYEGELGAHLVAGDEAEAWRLVQDALASALTAEQLYLDVLGPAMHTIGDDWAAGRISIAEEHRASALALPAGRPARPFVHAPRPDPRSHRAGRAERRPPRPRDRARRGPAPRPRIRGRRPRRRHARGIVRRGRAARRPDPRRRHRRDPRRRRRRGESGSRRDARAARPVPILVGGRAIENEEHARALGADGFSSSARDALAWFDAIDGRPRRSRSDQRR